MTPEEIREKAIEDVANYTEVSIEILSDWLINKMAANEHARAAVHFSSQSIRRGELLREARQRHNDRCDWCKRVDEELKGGE